MNSSASSNTALSPYNLAYYNEHKKTIGGAFGCSFLNFILGFGIGSFVQGDDSAGSKFLITDLIASLVLAGSLIYANCKYHERHPYDDPEYDYYPNEEITAMVFAFSGILTFCVSRICETIRPYSFKEQYNNQLYHSLMANNHFSMNIVPNFDTKFRLTGATVVGKITF